jgi:hypothetical protein
MIEDQRVLLALPYAGTSGAIAMPVEARSARLVLDA